MHGSYAVTAAPPGSRVGDKVMQAGQAFVLSTLTLERFHAETLEELQAALGPASRSWKLVAFAPLQQTFSERYETVEPARISPAPNCC